MSNNDCNVANRTLLHGDNLKFLRSINSNSVQLIATDPPFNKGRDFHATPDSLADGASFQDRWSWDKDVHEEWVDKITDDFPRVMNVIQGSRNSYGDDMGAFLCFMAVRLIEMLRILREDGSLYLHCDPTASHYLKELLDSIFGTKNFRNEIIWFKGYRGTPRKNRWQQEHDTILMYCKSEKYYWGNPTSKYKDENMARYNKVDEDGNRYALIKRKRTDGTIYYGKTYPQGKKAGDVIEIPIMASTDSERTGYPTQKPLTLYERIIEASSNKGGVVLDPFCGCATTCIAAERLGRQWVGIDIWDKAKQVIIDRFTKEGMLVTDKQRMDTDNEYITLFAEDVTFTTELPMRSDEGEDAVPYLKTKLKVDEPKGPKQTRAEMVAFLIEQNGCKCQGCDRVFDDPRYLELDHNAPRSTGGLNHISNRILLCSPCNRAKSNTLTLIGLRQLNKKNGWMAHS